MSSYLSNPPTGRNKAPDVRADVETTKRGAGRSKPFIFAGIVLAIISLLGFIYTFYPFYTPETKIIDLKDLLSEAQAESTGSQPALKLYPPTRPVTSEALREIPSNTSEQLSADAAPEPVKFAGRKKSAQKAEAHLSAPMEAQQQVPVCPQVSLNCPTDSVKEGQAVTITAKVGGNLDPARLIYKWNVIPEAKFIGQGRPLISVDTKGLGDSTIEVSLAVGGFDQRCGDVFRGGSQKCSVKINKSSAASTSGRIEGRVQYVDGTGVSGVRVRAINLETKATRDASTDTTGRYVISDLADGTYDVVLIKPPFSGEGTYSTRVSIRPPDHIGTGISFRGQAPTQTPTPTVSPTVSPSPTESPTPTITPTISPSISPSISPQPRPTSKLEAGEAGTIKVTWPPDLAKNWRGTIRADYIPPPGEKRPRDLIEGYTASAKIEFQGKGLKAVSFETGEKPLDDSSHEWFATVEPEDNAGSDASCKVMIELKLKNRETGEIKIIKRELAEAPLTVSTAPVTRNQSLGLSAGLGVMGLGLIGFGSRRRAEKRLVSSPQRESNSGAFITGGPEPPGGLEELLETAEPETTQYKQISAWITEREKEPQKPLRLKEPYTLNFKVGQRAVAATLLHGPEARVPETDIPEEGLDTEWIVVSRTVQLWASGSLPETSTVASKQVNNAAVWTARFPLHIPKSGDSRTISLRIIPFIAEQTGLDIYIHVDGELYRQLEVKFVVQDEDEIRPVLTGTDGEASHAGI